MSRGSKLDRIIAGKASGVFCRFFDEVLWRDRELMLSDLGFKPIPRSHLHEVSRSDVQQHLTYALAFDLCYGVKSIPKSDAAAIAADFTRRFHWQARFFVNTERPLSGASPIDAFSPLSDQATIDTGTMAKSGDRFAGMLWVFSKD